MSLREEKAKGLTMKELNMSMFLTMMTKVMSFNNMSQTSQTIVFFALCPGVFSLATVYGNGTYFAVEASYSARSAYAKPNASNTKHIYATKVLVGDFTTGTQGMLVPPNKPNNPDQLYDSVVDNVNKPNIYVIFHDAQAYPEYLIKFN